MPDSGKNECLDYEDSAELTEEEKQLIDRALIEDIFNEDPDEDCRGAYHCKRPCRMCSSRSKRSTKSSTRPTIVDPEDSFGDGVNLTKEIRRRIIEEKIHEFLNHKWNKRKELEDTHHKDGEEPEEVICENGKEIVITGEGISRDPRLIAIVKHGGQVEKVTIGLEKNNQHCKSVTIKRENTSFIDDGLLVNEDDLNMKTFTNPMDNPEHIFYINPKSVNVADYKYGLRYEKWNPTQCLYELSMLCGWGRPQFKLLESSSGFHFAVNVKGQTFTPSRRASNKKTAMHLASHHFLNHIGFNFKYNDPHCISNRSVHERLGMLPGGSHSYDY